MPMMSAKQKRFHSSPPGPTKAAIGEHSVHIQCDGPDPPQAVFRGIGLSHAGLHRCADATQFFNDRYLTLEDPLDAVAP